MKSKPKKKLAPQSNKCQPKKALAKARPVTKSRALQIAVKACTPNRRQFECHDAKPEGCRIFNTPAEPCWFIRCPWSDGSEESALQSRRLVIISRRTGRILYNDSAHDEG